jgi:mono/diheme cytochrome c family protein
MKKNILILLILVLVVSFSFSQDSTLEESTQRGSEIYADFCVTCHMGKGEGVPKAFPPLAGSDYLTENREASIRGVKYGQQGELVVNGVTYNGVMAPMGLEDEEIADVMNFVMNTWGNSSDKMVTTEEVEAIQKK